MTEIQLSQLALHQQLTPSLYGNVSARKTFKSSQTGKQKTQHEGKQKPSYGNLFLENQIIIFDTYPGGINGDSGDKVFGIFTIFMWEGRKFQISPRIKK